MCDALNVNESLRVPTHGVAIRLLDILKGKNCK